MENKLISEVERIVVRLDSPVRLMEVATKRALDKAVYRFGLDEYCYSDKVDEWERSCCNLKLEFVNWELTTGMCECSYDVFFNAWCEKNEKEDDDDE